MYLLPAHAFPEYEHLQLKCSAVPAFQLIHPAQRKIYDVLSHQYMIQSSHPLSLLQSLRVVRFFFGFFYFLLLIPQMWVRTMSVFVCANAVIFNRISNYTLSLSVLLYYTWCSVLICAFFTMSLMCARCPSCWMLMMACVRVCVRVCVCARVREYVDKVREETQNKINKQKTSPMCINWMENAIW